MPVPRYDLEGDVLDARRRALVEEIVSAVPAAEVAVAWIPSDHPGADVVRTEEARVFPEIVDFMSEVIEARCRFLVVVAPGPGADLKMASRVSSLRYGPPGPVEDGTIGIPMIDEVIEANPPLSAAEVERFHRDHGIELVQSIAVETNLRLADQGVSPSGLRWSDYGYIAMYQELMDGSAPERMRAVFAHVNAATRRSLGSVGVVIEPFLGRPELRSPAAQEGTFDDRYSPSTLLSTEGNLRVFRQLAELGAPEVRLG